MMKAATVCEWVCATESTEMECERMMSLLDEVYKASKITAVRTGCYFILISFMFLTSQQNQVFCLMEKDEKKRGKRAFVWWAQPTAYGLYVVFGWSNGVEVKGSKYKNFCADSNERVMSCCRVMADLGTDRVPLWKLPQRINTPMDQTKAHMPLQKPTSNQNNNNNDNNNNKKKKNKKNTQPFTVCCDIFLLLLSGNKNRSFSRRRTVVGRHCTLCLWVWGVQVVSCGANPFSPRSSHGDSSYYGYCMRCVSGIWCVTVQEKVCVHAVWRQPSGTLQAGW